MKAFKRNKKSKFIFGAVLVASVFILSSLMISCKNKDDDDDAIIVPQFVIKDVQDQKASDLLEKLKSDVSSQNAADDPLGITKVLNGDAEEFAEHDDTGTNYDYDKIKQQYEDDYDKLIKEAVDAGEVSQADVTGQNASGSYIIRTWTYEYSTKAANGEWIRASGTVSLGYAYIPIVKKEFFPKLNYVVIHPHYTKTADKEMPSKDKSAASDTAIMQQLACNDAMIISPDYEGYGSTASRKHPYLMHDAISKQCVDMLQSVINWYRNNGDGKQKFRGFESDWDLYTFGYSQGGAQALAIQKYIETNSSVSSELKEHFRGSVCGAGPYDPVATYQWYLSQTKVSYPVIFPLVLDGYIENYKNSYLKGYKLEHFLTKPMLEKEVDCPGGGRYTPIAALRSKKYDAHQIGKIIAMAYGHENERDVTVQEVLTEDAQKWDSEATKAVRKALEANSLVDGSWTPQHNIIFYHSYQDDVVPIVNYENAKKAFEGSGKLVPKYQKLFHKSAYDSNGIKMGKHSAEGAWFYANYIFRTRDFKYVKKNS